MAIQDIINRIEAAERDAGRDPGSVTLIAVSKMQLIERVEPVVTAGHRCFGENRVQEAYSRWPDFLTAHPDIELHLIGPLQTNKARQAMELFSAIHSVDRPKLARTLARLADSTGRCPDIFVQVNTGAEAQKAGALPDETDALIAECRELDLPIVGLMCIPPADQPAQRHFEMLATLAERNGLDCLSMGMSADFETAIACGATHIRVGSAVFGHRDAN